MDVLNRRRTDGRHGSEDIGGSGWITAGKIAWIAFAILTLVLFARGVPVIFQQIESCAGNSCRVPAIGLSAAASSTARALWIFAAYVVVTEAVSHLILFALSLILLRRQTDQRIALIAAFVLVGFAGGVFSAVIDSTATLGGVWQVGTTFTGFLGSAAIIPFLCLLPDGRFVPRWTRWLAGIWMLVCVVGYYTPPAPILNAASTNGFGMPMIGSVFFVAVVIAQVKRYRRYASPLQRQQIKWVVGGLGAAMTCIFLSILGPAAARIDTTSLLVNVLGGTFMSLALLMIPASIVMAIVKTHLWDIDRIINRALVYLGLSTCLIGVYIGAVLLLQRLFNPLTGQSDLAIALSTLVVAALFNPVRHRIHAMVDRRFYRQKYDAERALTRFGIAARDEVDLERLAGALTSIIAETVQPEHLSVWLREVENR